MENHVVYEEKTTAAELKKAAKLAGIKRYSSMTKNELLEALNESGSEWGFNTKTKSKSASDVKSGGG